MPSSFDYAQCKQKGFTLIELLVAISLVAILSAIGLVSFQSVRGKAQEAKYRGDVDAIRKAYEKNFDPTASNGQGGYKDLQTSDFSGGKIPTDKNGNRYDLTLKINNVVTSYGACINPTIGEACSIPSLTCICAVSTQGAGSKVSNISNPTCDPYGILGNGLVGYWNMDEASWNGTSGEVKDSSVTGANGTAAGNATTTASGKFSYAGTFDGNGDYVDLTNAPIFDISNKITVSAWIKPTTVTQNGTVACKWTTGGGANNSYCLLLGQDAGNNKFGFYLTQSAGTYKALLSTSTLTAGAWTHIVGVADGSTMRLYKDGIAEPNTTSYDGTIKVTTKKFFLGKLREEDSIYSYNGIIDDARIYNRGLSASEISALYNGETGCVP